MMVKFTTCPTSTPQEVPRRLERALIFGEALVNVDLPHMIHGILLDHEFIEERIRLGTTHIQHLEAKGHITVGIWRIEVWKEEANLHTLHWSILCADEKRGSLAPTLMITQERTSSV